MHIKILILIFCIYFTSSSSRGQIFSSSGPNLNKREVTSIGIGLLPPILTSTIERDLWIGAAMEERFYKSGMFSKNFFIPNSPQLNRSIRNCPFKVPSKCKELVGKNLNLSYIAEIYYQNSNDTLKAKIQLNHISDKDLSRSHILKIPAKYPYQFISQVIKLVFESMGPVEPIVLKVLNSFPTDNVRSYGCYVMGYRNINREEFKNAFYPLLRANELDPNFVDPLIDYVRTNLITGRLKESEKLVARDFPKTTWELELLRSEIYLRTGKINKSFHSLKSAEKLIPARTAELEFRFGDYYKRISASTRGISYIIAAINRNPSVLKYYLALGELYSQKGEYETSLPYFKKLVKLAPDNNFYRLNYGIALRESNYLNEAINFFKDILKDQPDFYPARMNLGIAYYKLGWYQKADKAFITNIALRQDTANSFLNLGILRILLGDQKAGKKLIRSAYLLKPNSVEALINLAKVEIYEGDPVQAEIYLQQAMTLGGPDTSIFLALADIYEQLKNPEQEYKFLNKALELDPENLTILTRLAEHLIRNSDYIEAINHLMEVIDIAPTAYKQRLMLANCLFASGDKKEALVQYQYIADNFSHSAEAILALGESYFENYLFSEAIITVEPLLAVEYVKFEANLLLGKCYLEQITHQYSRRMNASEMAVYYLSRAMMFKPTDWRVHYWFGRYQRLIKKNRKLALEHFKMSSQLASSRRQKLMIEKEIISINQ